MTDHADHYARFLRWDGERVTCPGGATGRIDGYALEDPRLSKPGAIVQGRIGPFYRVGGVWYPARRLKRA